MRFVPSVDLPVPVETAGVGQQLAALLALHRSLPVRPEDAGPDKREIVI